MLPEYIIYVSIPAYFIAYFLYIKDIFHGKTRPNLVSWSLWTLAPFIGVFLQIKAGANLAWIPLFTAGFGPLVVVIFSIFRKNSIWKINIFDVICGIFSILALVLYLLTHNLSASILFAILSDFFAFVPTFIKGWKSPETETSSVYYISIFSNILALLIIKNWIFPIYSFSVYLILANIVMMAIMYRKKILFWYTK